MSNKRNAIGDFQRAISLSVKEAEGRVFLESHRNGPAAGLKAFGDYCVSIKWMQEIYGIIVSDVQGHPLQDKIVSAVDAVYSLYEKFWTLRGREIADPEFYLTQPLADVLAGDELVKQLGAAVQDLRKYSRIELQSSVVGDDLALTAVARGLGLFIGNGKQNRPDASKVDRLVKAGELHDNGRQGRERRILRKSLEDYVLREELDWNEASATKRKNVAEL